MTETKDTAEQPVTDEILRQKQQYCHGCRNDFYNHDGHAMNGSHCWSLDDAHIVARYRLGWWTQPLNAKCFDEVITLDCHHEPGRFAFCKELPEHCRTKAEGKG